MVEEEAVVEEEEEAAVVEEEAAVVEEEVEDMTAVTGMEVAHVDVLLTPVTGVITVETEDTMLMIVLEEAQVEERDKVEDATDPSEFS